MKKKILFAIFAIAMLSQSMTVFAAPKKMPDGTMFDAAYYAATYPDVKAAFGNDEVMLYTHYALVGKAENRKPYATTTATATTSTAASNSDFDAAYYAATYPDVVAALGNNPDTLYQHWTLFGKSEGRRGKAPVVTPAKTEEEKKEDVEEKVKELIEDNEETVQRMLLKINDYRADSNRKELELNEDLVEAAQTVAYYNDLDDKSSKKGDGHSYTHFIDDDFDYDYSDCIYFESKSDTPKDVFAKLKEEDDDDELKEKVYRNIGMGYRHEYWIVILTD